MSRLRITFTTAALVLALAALTLNSLAQPPGGGGGGGRGGRGGGPGGGFGGPGGGFGGPGGGFGGPGGGSLLQLANNPAVQTDMKVTEKQKTQIKSLNDKYNAKMQEFWGQMGGPGGRGPGGGGPQGQGQGRGRNGNGNGQNGQAGNGGQGQVPDAQDGNGGGGRGNRGNRGNRNQNGQGIPEDPEVAQQRAEQREMMREAMNELRQSGETSLGRILDKGQATRLKQIQLQLAGPAVVLRDDMMEKLGIDEAQVEMLREIQGENRSLQRETGRSRRDVMKTAFARLTPTPRNNAQDGGDDGDGGNDANNGNNRRNGGGRGGRGNFDPEAMRKVMDSPEVKAQMEQIQGQEQKLTTQFAAAVNKVLTPRQRTMLKKMLGPPFDRSAMGRGGPWGGRGGVGPGNPAMAKGAAAAKAKASDDGDDDETPQAKAATAAPTKAKAAAPKRKSLREQRGEAPSDDN
jgi:hypothetical protein